MLVLSQIKVTHFAQSCTNSKKTLKIHPMNAQYTQYTPIFQQRPVQGFMTVTLRKKNEKKNQGQFCLNSENRGRNEEKTHQLKDCFQQPFVGRGGPLIFLILTRGYPRGSEKVAGTGFKTIGTCHVLANARLFPTLYIVKKTPFTIHLSIKKVCQQ